MSFENFNDTKFIPSLYKINKFLLRRHNLTGKEHCVVQKRTAVKCLLGGLFLFRRPGVVLTS